VNVELPAPGYNGPPVLAATLTVNAVEEPTVAEPVPDPVLEKYAYAPIARASAVTMAKTAAVRFLREMNVISPLPR
jgi:hypothetical protein